MAERAGASPDAGVGLPSLDVPSQLSWEMGKLLAALAGRDSQPIPAEAAAWLTGRGLVWGAWLSTPSWNTLLGEAPALAQGPETLAGW